jgi:hypothetical protein
LRNRKLSEKRRSLSPQPSTEIETDTAWPTFSSRHWRYRARFVIIVNNIWKIQELVDNSQDLHRKMKTGRLHLITFCCMCEAACRASPRSLARESRE